MSVPGTQGGPIFFRLMVFLAFVLCTNWCTTICITCLILQELECNEFVCNEFVLVLVQFDIIQFIISICTKTNKNLLSTNSLHSISRKIGHIIQIVVHLFGHKTTAEKIL
jgi:hypothetical protein